MGATGSKSKKAKKKGNAPSLTQRVSPKNVTNTADDFVLRTAGQTYKSADLECRSLPPGLLRADELPGEPQVGKHYDAKSPRHKRRRVAFAGAVVYWIPALPDIGLRLRRELYWREDDFKEFYKERRVLAIKAARFRLENKGDPLTESCRDFKMIKELDDDESRRGMGIDPLEQKILGARAERTRNRQRARSHVMEVQRTHSADGEDWDHVYDDVAAAAAEDETNRKAAEAAAEMGRRERMALVKNYPSLLELLKKSPSKARRIGGRAHSLRDLAETSYPRLPDLPEETTRESEAERASILKEDDPLDKFHTLIRADSLTNCTELVDDADGEGDESIDGGLTDSQDEATPMPSVGRGIR